MEEEAFSWQVSRLNALEAHLLDYLREAPSWLLVQLEKTRGQDRLDVLHALADLRVDAGEVLISQLAKPNFGPVEQAIEVLRWSNHVAVGPWLRGQAASGVQVYRRSQWRSHAQPPRKPSVPREVPYRAILRALRGHPSVETERFLVLAARDWDPTYRQAACGSLGWWEPLQRTVVLECLQTCRRDANPEVRQAARAALGRLGERHALHWFRQALTSEDTDNIYEAMHLIAAEGLFMLWPDLDRLADLDNTDIAHHAREALERLCEDMNM